MQNVVHNSNCDSSRDKEIIESGKDCSGSSSPLSGNISVERDSSVTSLHARFMAELSDSDDDDVSVGESFILEQGELDEEPGLDTSKFLLAVDSSENCIDVETQCRLEALLEGSLFENGHIETCSSEQSYEEQVESYKLSLESEYAKQFHDREVLRRLTSSVSCALDEAAAALNRMRSEPLPSSPSDQEDCRSLAEACNEGDINTVKRLLKEGHNVNEITEEGDSLLSLACSSGYYELVQLLLSTRANIEERGLKDTTPLMEAASAGHVDIVRLLIQHGADVNAQTCQEKRLKGAKNKNQELQLKSQQDLHSNLPSIVSPEGNTPLMFAAAGGHVEVAKVLLDAGANVEDHNENGHTPLMEAASSGHVGVAKLLVERGASINTHSNEFKESALTLACYKGHLEMVRFLLEAGADQEHKTDEMHTALMEASMDGHVEVARLLLDSGAQVNMPADSFESPLTLAACGGHVELAMLLLERGANIEEVNDEGYTPLMEASREGHEEMVALLLSQGADINAQTEETQETALTLACCGGFLEVADFLIKAGADIELGASTPLMEASQEGHLELVRYLINSGANVNATTATGDTALTYACENGHTDVADLLLQASAELEHESEGGRTPLMKAARAGHLYTVQFLISKGADVNKQTTNNDHNPLSLACAGGHLPIVELLLAHGADPTHKLKDNSTMLIEASKGGHTAVVQLLLDYPNSLLSSPPPPPELPQMSTQVIETNEAPRVPPHGLQVFAAPEVEQNLIAESYNLANVGSSVPRIQELIHVRDSLPGSTPQAVPKLKPFQRKVSTKNIEAPSSSVCENMQRHHFRSKTNVAAQANPLSIQAETNPKCCEEHSSCCEEGGGGGIVECTDDKDMKSCHRLEACINSMMKKAEMLNPSPEEQILQKQQILEELQRVERDLQEKAQAQLYITTQHHHQQQNLQGIGGTVSSTASARVPTVSVNSGVMFPSVSSSHAQQLLINSGTVLDIESLSSAIVPDLSAHLGLNLTTATTPVLSPSTTSAQTLIPQQFYQHSKSFQTPIVTSSVSSSDNSKSRLSSKQATKQAVLKQIQQQYYQLQQKQLETAIIKSQQTPPSSHLTEEYPGHLSDKLNLRNVVLAEQPQIHQQQLMHQNPQQQFVLSEFTQNLTLRANNQYADADTLSLMQAAGGIKFATDGTQGHSIPIFDPVSVGQVLLQQQMQQQQQIQQHQLTQAIREETRRQLQQPPFDKLIKNAKGKTNKAQQQTLLQTTQFQPLQMEPSQQQSMKQHLTTSCSDNCPLVASVQMDASGVLSLSGMGGPPSFPVSLTVSPVSLPSQAPMATNCGTALAHNISLDEGLMVAAPARTLHDTLGDIMTGPTTQLAGNQMTLTPQALAYCGDPCPGTRARSLSMTSLPGVNVSTSLPLTFHTLAPSVTPCVPLQVATQGDGLVSSHHMPHLAHSVTAPATPAQTTFYPPLDLNSQTDSNHDTALTLACAGGHEDLVSLLLSRGADIEHREKKGFTPLMLAATSGHAGVVEILLNHAADIEAQSERTKDTPLSMGCSAGRYEVVELLLTRGANKEHRNVSDYTPLSLAASGGFVNIIKLLLNHGAEINSRTGSKLGISPLMLAAMNGHVPAVKLLLDMGSDINAQIETNRNTALTLACFQGRAEVVSLLLDRKANVEHRAKTGLTPLMEAASGGYDEVGKVLIEKGADVNAPPVPSSRDTALTIAADKGHLKFVELLLKSGAIVDVKNKKGSSPLWLAANGGHLEVVELLVRYNADIDSQDNRKVSCLMAAFRKGHIKTVKWMVEHVTQFPSDQEIEKFLASLSEKVSELRKKCIKCAEEIKNAKDKQADEANKNATILLEELDQERSREESRKAAAARRRERKRRKKREKQEQLRAAKVAAEESKKSDKTFDLQDSQEKQQSQLMQGNLSDVEDDDDDDDYVDSEDVDERKPESRLMDTDCIRSEPHSRLREYSSPQRNGSSASSNTCGSDVSRTKEFDSSETDFGRNSSPKKESSQFEKRRGRDREKIKTQQKNKKNSICKSNSGIRVLKEINVAEKHFPKTAEPLTSASSMLSSNSSVRSSNRKRNLKQDVVTTSSSPTGTTTTTSSIARSGSTNVTSVQAHALVDAKCHSVPHRHKINSKELMVNGITGSSTDYDEFCSIFNASVNLRGKSRSSVENKLALEAYGELALDLAHSVPYSSGLKSPSAATLSHSLKSPVGSSNSPKKWQKRDEGWKEVVRRSKKVSVPANAISRVIGRGGCNINAIREESGAHIEVEKQKGQGERTIIIRGSAESTRLAQHLISALIKEPEKELTEILARCGLNRFSGANLAAAVELSKSSSFATTTTTSVIQAPVSSIQQGKGSARLPVSTKTLGMIACTLSKPISIPPPSLPANSAPPFSNQTRPGITGTQNMRPGIPVCTAATPPFLHNSHNAWTGVVVTGKVPANAVPRAVVPLSTPSTTISLTTVTTRVLATTTIEKSPVARQLFSQEKNVSSHQISNNTTATKTTVSYTMAVIAQSKSSKSIPASVVSVTTKMTSSSDIKVSTGIPTSVERAGSAPPASAVMNSQLSVGHTSGTGLSTIQPFSTTSRSSTVAVITQNSTGPHLSRMHRCQTPTQGKPFVNSAPASNQTSPTNNPPSTSAASSVIRTSLESTIAREYTPFNNLFSKVAQPCVWGQKEKEAMKPNFASVAASGVTSVACQVQNSNPIQSNLTLSLPQTVEHELIVDAAKAPGYRGNLHISPSASSNSSTSSISSQQGMSGNNFGPIGSGPRSAPCTPPLGPIGPPSSSGTNTRRSTPPTVPSPPPFAHQRSATDSHKQQIGEMTHSNTGSAEGPTQQQPSSQLSEGMFHHQGMNMSSHLNRMQSYQLASTFTGPSGTTTTYSQHSPLSSVGNIVPEGTNNNTSNNNNNMHVVQSNLNPNAPDFSSRTSLLMAQHGPPIHHLPPRLPSAPNSFQENSVPPHLAQFRPILSSSGGMNPTFPLHAIPNHHPQQINRFPIHQGQQQQGEYNHNTPAGPIGSLPPGMGSLSQNTDTTLPILNMIGGFAHHPSQVVLGGGDMTHHFQMMHSMMGIRPNQRSTNATPTVSGSSKDEGSPMAITPNASPQSSNLPSPNNIVSENPNPAGTIGEDRKLPRPIGMERAQRKNPMFGMEMPTTADWIQSMQGLNTGPPMPQEESGLPPLLHNNYVSSRFNDMLASENNHPVDHSYQGGPVSAGSGCYPFMNGLPPHMLAAHLYTTTNNAAASALEQQQQQQQLEMWNSLQHHKIPLSSGDGLPQNIEHKMAWQSWGHHQA